MSLRQAIERILREERALRARQGRRGTIIAKKIYCKHCRHCQGHGPYLYRVWHEQGKLRWKYLGKEVENVN